MKKMPQEAIADLTRAIALRPNNPVAHLNRGTAYNEQGRYDLAIADFTAYIAQSDKPDANAYTHRGHAYNSTGRLDEAIADFTTALRLRPNDKTALHNRSVALRKKAQQAGGQRP